MNIPNGRNEIERLFGRPANRDSTLDEDAFHAALDEVWACAKSKVGPGGSNRLSLHSYGIAIDWNPEHNPRRPPLTRPVPDRWFEAWTRRGWSDGRASPTPDPMHVRFATGA